MCKKDAGAPWPTLEGVSYEARLHRLHHGCGAARHRHGTPPSHPHGRRRHPHALSHTDERVTGERWGCWRWALGDGDG